MDEKNVELKLLRCLLALVEESNVTRAAERVELSQPRMSNALRRLRELTKDPLLVRAGQRLVPTDRALEIARRVRESLATIDQALWTPDEFKPEDSHRSFSIMMSDYTAVLLLPMVLKEVRTRAPDISISVLQISHDNLQRSMDEGLCDIAFGYFSNLHPNLRISNCFQDRAVTIANRDWHDPDAPFDLREFLAAAHVGMGDPAGTMSTLDLLCDRELQALGHRRTIAARAPTPYSVARIVAQTDLVGILPERMALEYSSHLPLLIRQIPLPQPSFDVAMVWHERSHRDPGHVWLRAQFRCVAERLLN